MGKTPSSRIESTDQAALFGWAEDRTADVDELNEGDFWLAKKVDHIVECWVFRKGGWLDTILSLRYLKHQHRQMHLGDIKYHKSDITNQIPDIKYLKYLKSYLRAKQAELTMS